jgi:hypothetical protein
MPSVAEAYVAQNGMAATRALFRSADIREGPLAFAQRREPNWKGS